MIIGFTAKQHKNAADITAIFENYYSKFNPIGVQKSEKVMWNLNWNTQNMIAASQNLMNDAQKCCLVRRLNRFHAGQASESS